MKKTMTFIKSIFFIGFLCVSCLNSFGQKTVRVSTIDEFFEAISSNTTIELEEGNYDISKIDPDKKTNSVKMQLLEDGVTPELIINGISNVKIIGIGKKQSKIYTTNSGSTVLSFRNCKNIIIDNIDAGHKLTNSGGYVIAIFESENFTIKNSNLYGSYSGVFTNQVKKLSLKKTTITGCSSTLFELYGCMNALLDSCTFTKTTGGALIDNCLGLTISNSEFSENGGDVLDLNSPTYLFQITASTNIKLLKSIISNNTTSYFTSNSQSINIDLETVDFNDNSFINMFEK